MTSAHSRPRILYCESNVDGTIGGSHYCLLYLVEGLDKRRFEPIVVFREQHALVPRFAEASDTRILERPAPYVPALVRSPLAQRLPWLFLPVRIVQRLVNFLGFLNLVRRNVGILRAERIALVHLNNSIVRSHDWMLAAWLTRTPCLTHERGINTHFPPLAQFLGRRQDAIISMSQSIADYMKAAGVDMRNVIVLYDGIDPAVKRTTREAAEVRRELGIPDGAPVIGIVGNVRKWKGQEVVVRALPALVRAHPSLVCLVVGKAGVTDQDYYDHLTRLTRELGVEANIRFLGYQKFPADYVDVMDVVIHASIQPEPFGMVVLEAMAQRKPLVGSRAGGVPEMVVEGVTGFTYPPGDSATLAARVGELLADPERMRRMGDVAHDRVVSDFHVETYVRDVERLYDAVLAGQPIPRFDHVERAARAHRLAGPSAKPAVPV